MVLIIFILVSFAITSILTREYIFLWLRKLLPFKPFTCPNCMSFWVGFFISFVFPGIDFILYSAYLSPIFYGCVSYTLNRILTTILTNLGELFIN